MDDGELLALLHGIRTHPIRVCRMSPYFAGKIGAQTNIVLLSRDTVGHIEAKHRERDLKLYRLAETIVTDGTLYEVEARKVIAVWHSPQNDRGAVEIYKAVLKATKNGREIFLTSVHRIDARAVRALQRRAHSIGGVIRGAV